jgi:hypothetical protein
VQAGEERASFEETPAQMPMINLFFSEESSGKLPIGQSTSFPGSLLLSSGRDPGCGWSRASQILGGKFNCNCERGGKGACL